MVVVMIVAFMVAWTPYATFAILVTIHPTIELDPRLASIPAFFSKTATVYNPIIYVFMNKQVPLLLLFHSSLWFLSGKAGRQRGGAGCYPACQLWMKLSIHDAGQ